MRVLVTGGAGFIGSNIVDALIAKKHSVVIVDDLSSGKKKNINKKAKFYMGSIGDNAFVTRVFKKERIDVLCHHAAQIDVRKSVADPRFDATVNVLGTLNLLENCVAYKVKKVIFASSGGTIYGECGARPPKENAPALPLSPYGITKFTVEKYLAYYAYTYGLRFTVLRYGNVYGPRQDPHGEAGVIAIFANKILADKPVVIFGDGKQMRDYVYVQDVVKANLAALRKGDNLCINIGTKVPTSVNKLFQAMAKIEGCTSAPQYKPARQGELHKSVLDNALASKVLNWKPKMSLSKGLKETVAYFKSNR